MQSEIVSKVGLSRSKNSKTWLAFSVRTLQDLKVYPTKTWPASCPNAGR